MKRKDKEITEFPEISLILGVIGSVEPEELAGLLVIPAKDP